jgi:hypothetical protein
VLISKFEHEHGGKHHRMWGCRTAAGMCTVWRACRWVRVVVAVPGVSVFDERARVAHKVAIGSVDKKRVET